MEIEGYEVIEISGQDDFQNKQSMFGAYYSNE